MCSDFVVFLVYSYRRLSFALVNCLEQGSLQIPISEGCKE